ncbi:hypothetical protein Tco_1398035 [Tanacetum coccineum]
MHVSKDSNLQQNQEFTCKIRHGAFLHQQIHFDIHEYFSEILDGGIQGFLIFGSVLWVCGGCRPREEEEKFCVMKMKSKIKVECMGKRGGGCRWLLKVEKRSEGGRGVKEKDKVADVVSLAVTDELVVKDKQDTSVDTCIPNVENTSLNSYPPLPTQESYPAGNTPGMSSYANVTSVPSKKAVNIRTLFTPGGMGLILLCWWSQSERLAKGL